jgi:hypothetical protein
MGSPLLNSSLRIHAAAFAQEEATGRANDKGAHGRGLGNLLGAGDVHYQSGQGNAGAICDRVGVHWQRNGRFGFCGRG